MALHVFLAWDASRESADTLLGTVLEDLRPRERDRNLAFDLVRGVFRWRGRLDWQLGHLVDRGLDDLHPPILWILRLGLYQLEHLDRIPARSAVDTSVELAKRFGHRGSASLVNAVLRRASTGLVELAPPDPAADPVGHLVARTSHPRWLLTRWVDRYGFRKTLELAAANNRKPLLTLRPASDRVGALDLIEELREAGVPAEPGLHLTDTVRLPEGWHSAVGSLLSSGRAVVQDEAAGLVAYVARPAAGLRVLDVCAAPGGKVLHFAERCGEATIVACDRSTVRLRRLCETGRGAAGSRIHLLAADGRRPATRGGFDRVLVDVPCSNTGVLGKRPDARWRRGPRDLERLVGLQGELLDAARGQVGPEGLLVYSTCSLEPEENEGVIRSYLERHPDDAVVSAGDVLPGELVTDGYLAVDPATHSVDGAFAAALRPASTPCGAARSGT
jgi:16S rRNA (cytosine967-C5)-methyltransferase